MLANNIFCSNTINQMRCIVDLSAMASIPKPLDAISMLLKHICDAVRRNQGQIRSVSTLGLWKDRSAYQTFWRQSSCKSSESQLATHNVRLDTSISVGTVISIPSQLVITNWSKWCKMVLVGPWGWGKVVSRSTAKEF